MPITIKELLASDTISQASDKVNFNFDQLLLNGGGPVGPFGPIGPPGPIGGRGIRGSWWYEDPSGAAGTPGDPGENPNDIPTLLPNAIANDNYLQADGEVWEYNGSVWIDTGVNLKGIQGIAGTSEDWRKFGPPPTLNGGVNVLTPVQPSTVPSILFPVDNDIFPLSIGGLPFNILGIANGYAIEDSLALDMTSGNGAFGSALYIHVPGSPDHTNAIKFSGSNTLGGNPDNYCMDEELLATIGLGIGDRLLIQDSQKEPQNLVNMYGLWLESFNKNIRMDCGIGLDLRSGTTSSVDPTLDAQSSQIKLWITQKTPTQVGESQIILLNEETGPGDIRAEFKVGTTSSILTSTASANIYGYSLGTYFNVDEKFNVTSNTGNTADCISLNSPSGGGLFDVGRTLDLRGNTSINMESASGGLVGTFNTNLVITTNTGVQFVNQANPMQLLNMMGNVQISAFTGTTLITGNTGMEITSTAGAVVLTAATDLIFNITGDGDFNFGGDLGIQAGDHIYLNSNTAGTEGIGFHIPEGNDVGYDVTMLGTLHVGIASDVGDTVGLVEDGQIWATNKLTVGEYQGSDRIMFKCISRDAAVTDAASIILSDGYTGSDPVNALKVENFHPTQGVGQDKTGINILVEDVATYTADGDRRGMFIELDTDIEARVEGIEINVYNHSEATGQWVAGIETVVQNDGLNNYTFGNYTLVAQNNGGGTGSMDVNTNIAFWLKNDLKMISNNAITILPPNGNLYGIHQNFSSVGNLTGSRYGIYQIHNSIATTTGDVWGIKSVNDEYNTFGGHLSIGAGNNSNKSDYCFLVDEDVDGYCARIKNYKNPITANGGGLWIDCGSTIGSPNGIESADNIYPLVVQADRYTGDGTWAPSNTPNSVNLLAVRSDGSVWIGGEKGGTPPLSKSSQVMIKFDTSFYQLKRANGSVTGGVLFATSDERLKKNIIPLGDNVLSQLLNLSPITYEWTDEYQKMCVENEMPVYPGKDGEEASIKAYNEAKFRLEKFYKRTGIGFIAQDVEKEFPDVVNINEGGKKEINYPNMVAYLTKGMQEQQKMIEKLQQDVALLQKK